MSFGDGTLAARAAEEGHAGRGFDAGYVYYYYVSISGVPYEMVFRCAARAVHRELRILSHQIQLPGCTGQDLPLGVSGRYELVGDESIGDWPPVSDLGRIARRLSENRFAVPGFVRRRCEYRIRDCR